MFMIRIQFVPQAQNMPRSEWSDCLDCDVRKSTRGFKDAKAVRVATCSNVVLLDTEDCSQECVTCAPSPWEPQEDCSVSWVADN